MINSIRYEKLVKMWYTEHKKIVKESSAYNYSVIIYNHLIPKFGTTKVKKINHNNIQEYIFELSDAGLSNRTIKTIVIVLINSLKYAVANNYTKNFNFNFSYPKSKKIASIEIFSNNEKNKIIKYLLNNIKYFDNIGILIAMLTGIRIGELCALKWEDIDFKNKTICINKTLQRIYEKTDKINSSKIVITTPKTYTSIRNIPISKELLKVLKENKKEKGMYILTGCDKYMEPRLIRKHYELMLKKLNMQHLKFHSLRHTFASNAIQLGVDYKTVSELLGHSNVNTTLQLYVHSKLEQKKKCMELISKDLTKF